MAYPTFSQLATSTATQLDDVITERASDGTLRGRALASGRKQRFDLRHVLTAADVATLDAHYDANRAVEFSMTWSGDATAYTVIYTAPPQYKPLGGGYFEANVKLEQV